MTRGRAARLGVIAEIAPDIAAHEAANTRAALLGQSHATRPSSTAGRSGGDLRERATSAGKDARKKLGTPPLRYCDYCGEALGRHWRRRTCNGKCRTAKSRAKKV